MNLLKNTMLLIISIQIMVVMELMVVKYGSIEKHFNRLFSTFTLHTHLSTPVKVMALSSSSIETKSHKVINVPLTKEKEAFVKKMTLALGGKIKEFSTYVGEYMYISNDTLNFDTRKNLESQAKKFLGIRYVWGATGPNKFDCSGFTQKVYKTAGIKLPRHSTRQAMVGQYIEYKDLQRGDMVFFDTSKSHKGVVNHVGIYLEDGKFIHASSGKKKVVITDFKKKRFYKNRFLWGRRILKDNMDKKLEYLSLNNKVMHFLALTTFKKI